MPRLMFLINQVILYWPSDRSEVSCIDSRLLYIYTSTIDLRPVAGPIRDHLFTNIIKVANQVVRLIGFTDFSNL